MAASSRAAEFLEMDTALTTSGSRSRKKRSFSDKSWGPGSTVWAPLPASWVTDAGVFTSLGKSVL